MYEGPSPESRRSNHASLMSALSAPTISYGASVPRTPIPPTAKERVGGWAKEVVKHRHPLALLFLCPALQRRRQALYLDWSHSVNEILDITEFSDFKNESREVVSKGVSGGVLSPKEFHVAQSELTEYALDHPHRMVSRKGWDLVYHLPGAFQGKLLHDNPTIAADIVHNATIFEVACSCIANLDVAPGALLELRALGASGSRSGFYGNEQDPHWAWAIIIYDEQTAEQKQELLPRDRGVFSIRPLWAKSADEQEMNVADEDEPNIKQLKVQYWGCSLTISSNEFSSSAIQHEFISSHDVEGAQLVLERFVEEDNNGYNRGDEDSVSEGEDLVQEHQKAALDRSLKLDCLESLLEAFGLVNLHWQCLCLESLALSAESSANLMTYTVQGVEEFLELFQMTNCSSALFVASLTRMWPSLAAQSKSADLLTLQMAFTHLVRYIYILFAPRNLGVLRMEVYLPQLAGQNKSTKIVPCSCETQDLGDLVCSEMSKTLVNWLSFPTNTHCLSGYFIIYIIQMFKNYDVLLFYEV
ncbi:hypothetical protein LXA43DRAFT_1066947 [Ganoderma leucocontextum]|nr:hypothetical protein LXA43DRAFT_1066947 [Ganoderma leucocontextum]